MICGQPPFPPEHHLAVLAKQQRGDFTPATTLVEGSPGALDGVFARAIEPDPDKRYPSVSHLVDALERAARGVASMLPPPAGKGDAAVTRGAALLQWRDLMRLILGDPEETRRLGSLDEGTRADILGCSESSSHDAETFLRYVRATCPHEADLLAAGQKLGTTVAVVAVEAMRIARTPETMLHIVPTLAARNHNWVASHVDRVDLDEATLVLTTPASTAPFMCTILRGGIPAMLEAIGVSCSVVERECRRDGAPSCRLHVRWRSTLRPGP
jgi:hypothetical protein